MPKNTSGLRPWKPGESGNPSGTSKLQQHRAYVRRVTRDSLKDLVDLALESNLKKLKDIVKDPASPALKVGVATSLAKAIQKGDWGTLQSIVDTLLGKVPEKLQVEASSLVRVSKEDRPVLDEAIRKFYDDF